MNGYERELGRHGEAIEHLKDEVHALRADVADMKDLLAETKGGVRVLLGVASVGGVIGAALVKLLAFLKGGG